MIQAKNTESKLGLSIIGDFNDFQNLLDALYRIIGNEDEYLSFEGSKTRILGLCYDIRHSIMGDREYELVENAVDIFFDKLDLTNRNVYLKFNVLWPEILFVTNVLNNFIRLNKKQFNDWNQDVVIIRSLQSAVVTCLQGYVSKTAFLQFMRSMQNSSFSSYMTQYIDVLNVDYIYTAIYARPRTLSGIIKRLTEQNDEYNEIKKDILQFSKEHNMPFEEVQLDLEYPEEIKW